MLRLEVKPYTLDFKFSAKTSRGSLQERKVWFIKLTDDIGRTGIGEVAPIERLSPENLDEIPIELNKIATNIIDLEIPTSREGILEMVDKHVSKELPSIRFGLEVALMDLIGGGGKYIFTDDTSAISIPINGLIWMGDRAFMKEQISEKLDQGYKCIKLKIGALDFDAEVEIIKNLRSVSEELVIRLDANGAFQTHEVLAKLKRLSQYNIHSIEQPILPMQPEAMEIVCTKSEIPIAFDEELIHVFRSQDKMSLLQDLKPHYLVLKPTLHGGFSSVLEWIDLASMHSIDWWITSYLESNIGLNAIAQFTSQFQGDMYHGLGTGNLYANNIISPILIEEGKLSYAKTNVWGDIDF